MPTINQVKPGTPGAFTPYGGCAEFFNSKDYQVFLYGGTGTGKTITCCNKMLLLCSLYPGCKFLFTRSSYTALIKSGVETFEKVLASHGLKLGRKPDQIRKFGESKPTEYLFPFMRRMGLDAEGNPRLYEGHSRIILGSLDNARNELGSEYDFVYVNQPEQSDEDDWTYVCSRADGRNGCAPFNQVFGDPNPEYAQHWIKKGGYELEEGDSPSDGRWRLIKSTYHDNPVIWNREAPGECTWTGISGSFTKVGKERIERALQSYNTIMAQRLVRGEWASYEGLVYAENWDRKQHIISSYELEHKYPNWREWDSYWAIDFGYDDPFVWMEFRKHPERSLYINTKLIYMSNKTILDHAETIRRNTLGDRPPKLIVADRNPQEIMLLQQALGYNIISAKKGPASVKARINVLTDMLKNNEIQFLDDALVEEDPRLVRDKKPIGFIQEVEVIRWRDNTRLVNDMPMDGDDHCENAAGYLFTHIKADDHRVKAVWL